MYFRFELLVSSAIEVRKLLGLGRKHGSLEFAAEGGDPIEYFRCTMRGNGRG